MDGDVTFGAKEKNGKISAFSYTADIQYVKNITGDNWLYGSYVIGQGGQVGVGMQSMLSKTNSAIGSGGK